MVFDRKGLLDRAAITKVLSREDSVEGFKQVRDEFRRKESVLAEDVQHWIKREIENLKEKVGVTPDHVTWVSHLLERYLIRGFNLYREAVTQDLDDQFRQEQ